MKSIEKQLILHEGIRLKPYMCPAGYLTIGVGRNLETNGITRSEAICLLQNDIRDIEESLKRYEWYNQLDPVRQKVIIDMAFNLGVNGLLKFIKMIVALEQKDYHLAADEMIDSAWFRQVGERGPRLTQMMRTGEDYKS